MSFGINKVNRKLSIFTSGNFVFVKEIEVYPVLAFLEVELKTYDFPKGAYDTLVSPGVTGVANLAFIICNNAPGSSRPDDSTRYGPLFRVTNIASEYR